MSSGVKVLLILGLVLLSVIGAVYVTFQIFADEIVASLGENVDSFYEETMADAEKRNSENFNLLLGTWQEEEKEVVWNFRADSTLTVDGANLKFRMDHGLLTTVGDKTVGHMVLPLGQEEVKLQILTVDGEVWENFSFFPDYITLHRMD